MKSFDTCILVLRLEYILRGLLGQMMSEMWDSRDPSSPPSVETILRKHRGQKADQSVEILRHIYRGSFRLRPIDQF